MWLYLLKKPILNFIHPPLCGGTLLVLRPSKLDPYTLKFFAALAIFLTFSNTVMSVHTPLVCLKMKKGIAGKSFVPI